eukprot:gene32166-16701_t
MLRLLVLSLLAAFAAAASVSMPVRREMTEQADSTAGWWGALQTNEAYCGLRNFPPIPNGYGIARILCGGHVGVYDHYWMWRITKEATVSTEADTYPPSVFKTGEKLYLSIFVPMKPWCGLSKGGQAKEKLYLAIFVPMKPWCGLSKAGQAKCGYGSDEASPFYLESVAKPGVDGIDIDIAADPFYLKTEPADEQYLKAHMIDFLTVAGEGINTRSTYDSPRLWENHQRTITQLGLGPDYLSVMMEALKATLEDLSLPGINIDKAMELLEGSRDAYIDNAATAAAFHPDSDDQPPEPARSTAAEQHSRTSPEHSSTAALRTSQEHSSKAAMTTKGQPEAEQQNSKAGPARRTGRTSQKQSSRTAQQDQLGAQQHSSTKDQPGAQ